MGQGIGSIGAIESVVASRSAATVHPSTSSAESMNSLRVRRSPLTALRAIAHRRNLLDSPRTGSRGRPRRVSSIVRFSTLTVRALSVDLTSQNPPGESAHTERARPLRASSIAIHPPIELPARCAVEIPSESSSRSTSSMRCEMTTGRSPAGVPPRCPIAVSAIVSWCGARRGTTWRHIRSLPRMPWNKTRGSPEP